MKINNLILGMLSFLLLCANGLQAGSVLNERTGITYADLQDAINNAEPNDVLELQGTFFGNFTNFSLVFERGTYISLILKGHEDQSAVLNGNASGPVFTVNDSGSNVNVIFRNLTIENGSTNGNGGGIASNSSTYNTVIVKNCTIKDNIANNGGGISFSGILNVFESNIYNNQANLIDRDGGSGAGIFSIPGIASVFLMVKSNVYQNNAENQGGGLYLTNTGGGTSGFSIIDSQVNNNRASEGGGIFADSQVYSIINSKVSRNEALNGVGGGIRDSVGTIFVESSTFSHNSASSDGGGLHLDTSVLTTHNTKIRSNNSGGDGGGIYASNVDLDFYSTKLARNTTTGNGGGIFVTSFGGLYFRHVELKKNQAANGGGTYIDVGNLTAEHVKFIGNSASIDGGGLYNNNVAGFHDAEFEFNQAATDGGGIFNTDNGVLTLTEVKFKANTPNDHNNLGTIFE